MSQKNFTNATGNWTVGSDDQINYSSNAKLEGTIQATDFLDADGNSIVIDGGKYLPATFYPEYEYETFGAIANEEDVWETTKLSADWLYTPKLQAGRSHFSEQISSVLGLSSNITYGFITGALGGFTEVIALGGISIPASAEDLPFSIDEEEREGLENKTRSIQKAFTVTHETLGRTVEIDKEGIIRARQFTDMDGNPIGGGDDLHITYDGESGWTFHTRDFTGNPPITFSSVGRATFARKVTAQSLDAGEGSVAGGDGYFSGFVRAADFQDADGNPIGKSLWTEDAGGDISRQSTVKVEGGLLAAQPDAATGAFSAGLYAGSSNQGQKATALGYYAGGSNQAQYATALGYYAGRISQQEGAVAIGQDAGSSEQGFRSVAIGYRAGKNSQSIKSISIGNSAGESNQRSYSIAIGMNAGQTNQGGSGIIISSGSSAVNNTTLGHIVLNSPNGSLIFNGTNKWTFDGGPVQATDFLDADSNPLPKSATVRNFVTLTQAQYDALSSKNSNTIYFIQE